jgi:hypothetical protein
MLNSVTGLQAKFLLHPTTEKKIVPLMPGKKPQYILCFYFDPAQRSSNFEQWANRSLQLAQNDAEIE